VYFQQFYLTCLSHASYMVGSEGVAAVVDPQRDVQIYVDEAAAHGLKIEHVIETHLHADFVSGHRELAERTGARIYLGSQAGAKFDHVPVHEGDSISFGRCKLRFLETPGHTLESISILITDLDRSPEPYAVLTGDTLFIGDVGRPDLSPSHTPRELAALLYHSLQEKLLNLPDDVEIYPAHGAGSLCGRQLSKERLSTIGKERVTNYALQARGEAEFIDMLTADLPERPAYFAADAEINRTGAAALTELAPLGALTPGELIARQKEGAIVLDTRPASDFAAAHVPGSVQIGLGGQYASWAGRVLPMDATLVLVAEDAEKANESRLRLARIGMEHVAGYLRDGISAWSQAGFEADTVTQISVLELDDMLKNAPGELQLVDVRAPSEFQEGHIPGAVLKPLERLQKMLDDLDRAKPVAVNCKGGYRSTIGASLLQRAGFHQVLNVTGGVDAWRACGKEIVQ
jgi:hydroxyacylglutathione hydrolase